MPKRLLVIGMVGLVGCATPAEPKSDPLGRRLVEPVYAATEYSDAEIASASAVGQVAQAAPEIRPPRLGQAPVGASGVVLTTDAPTATAPTAVAPTATAESADDATDVFSLVDYILNESPADGAVVGESAEPSQLIDAEQAGVYDPTNIPSPMTAATPSTVPLNLPSALAMVGGQHPVVGFAQWRVQEAYARLARAEALWLPSIRVGVGFHRHDGNYQASNGEIVDVNRNSFQYGLGNGATGAGTTTRPGIAANFHLADAIFQPKVARNDAWARGHAAKATLNQQLLIAALAYTDLVSAHQDVSILAASRDRAEELAKLTRDFAETGQGLQADADRLETELQLLESRLIAGREQAAVASARLSQALSFDGYREITPMDVQVVPLELAIGVDDKAGLISTGLAMRPELKESQALVAAACQAYRREKFAPFVPSVLLGFSTGGFGGGLGNDLDDIDGRYDFDALVSWELRNMGMGEKAARRERSAQVQQARFEKVRVMDQVAREVSESLAQVQFRHQQIGATEKAIVAAESSYDLNVKRIRDGEGLPLEVLQSLDALETARRAYLRAVVQYNQAQFRLQWAQGWPVQGD